MDRRSLAAALIAVALLLTSAYTAAQAIGPSFDCSKAATPAQQLICSGPELSRIDLEYNQAYYAMRQQVGVSGWQALKVEAIAFQNQAVQRCGIPQSGSLPSDARTAAACLGTAFLEQRAVWIRRLQAAGAEEASRPPEEHIELQRRLQALGYLPSDAAADGIYGAGTRDAIVAWQHANALTPDGFLSNADAQMLMGGRAAVPAALGETLYRARRETVGCRDPQALRTLLNASPVQRGDQQWVAATWHSGHCVRIEPAAPWTLVSLQGDLAVMRYRGSTTPPVSLYASLAEFVPDETQSAQQTTGPASLVDQFPPTVPTGSTQAGPINASTPTASTPAVIPAPRRETPAEAVPTPTQNGAVRPAAPPQASQDSPGTGVVVAFFLAAAGIIGILIFKARSTRQAIERALGIVQQEIDGNAPNLRVRRMQLVQPDVYGTVSLDRWQAEKARYVDTRILPALRAHGLEQWFGEIGVRVDLLIEEAAQRRITPGEHAVFVSSPETFDPRMNPIDYERYCALQLERAGWSTRLTAATGDQGADIVATRADGKRLVVQCKLYSQPVGNDAVQQVHAARTFQSADFAAVVSNQPFTRSARELANVNGVRLLHHEQLCAFTG